jgi:hypothetical protein
MPPGIIQKNIVAPLLKPLCQRKPDDLAFAHPMQVNDGSNRVLCPDQPTTEIQPLGGFQRQLFIVRTDIPWMQDIGPLLIEFQGPALWLEQKDGANNEGEQEKPR